MPGKYFCTKCQKNHQSGKLFEDHKEFAAVEGVTTPTKKESAKKETGGSSGSSTTGDAQVLRRIERLEAAVQELSGTVQQIVRQLKPAPARLLGTQSREFSEKDVRRAISTCLRSKSVGERWVPLDDVVGVLQAGGSGDRESLYRVIAEMFYNDSIDLAEGGNPKYPLRIQGNNFGMVALQNGS
jgi:hypothetical protein